MCYASSAAVNDVRPFDGSVDQQIDRGTRNMVTTTETASPPMSARASGAYCSLPA